MKSWIRWQDWVALIAGAYLALATIWVGTSDGAMATMIVLGALLVIASLWSLAMPTSMSGESAHVVLGVVTFISPWVIGFADLDGPSWTSWVVGVIAVAVGLAALPEIRHQAAPTTQ
ncbi:SPW repeat domain-containing protein [Solicola gregarius]|uniref:SPW repeat protein n=1 Tax=Solicola gregarius TaxID=2908642 RepID=A0AA46TH25_9ACTN|nr:SPW repeat protein [Solicola gregarius]UYM04388.1 SPW repeat protein [Solicola gregarius]